jgi:hypothetical protein
MTESTGVHLPPDLLRPGTLRRAADQDYCTPTPEEIRALLRFKKLSAGMAASIVGVSPRRVRMWTSEPDSAGYVAITYSAWRLLLLETGVVNDLGNWQSARPSDDRAE